MNQTLLTANLHSIETCGTVDGPGIRYVIFFQGCPLRCKYCHNPDTWHRHSNQPTTVDELMQDIRKYRSYQTFSGGGVTATGGEPLLQHAFVAELFKRCRAEGIHTALDTSGYASVASADEVLAHTDLLLLDIKSIHPVVFRELTGVPLDPTLAFLKRADEKGITVWVRYVLVPGITDNLEDVAALGNYLRQYKHIERVDVLPFHKMGEYKWQELGLAYQLADTPPPTQELIDKVVKLLSAE